MHKGMEKTKIEKCNEFLKLKLIASLKVKLIKKINCIFLDHFNKEN